jgi:BirA family biotin operon repressor/biotin-[acetyl-CoA-carboxylase] ligase
MLVARFPLKTHEGGRSGWYRAQTETNNEERITSFMWIDELQRMRKERLIGQEIYYFQEIDSTNRKAQDQARKAAREGTVVLADLQSEGKGRRGRVWESPPGVNLYASVILRPHIPPVIAPQITLLAGVAIANALARTSGLDLRIKWPNDIFLRGKKVAGILSEMEAEGDRIRFIILGMGINLNWRTANIPPNLRKIATSLGAETGKEIPRQLVAAENFEELEQKYKLFLQEGFSPTLREEWNRLSWTRGKQVTLQLADQEISGQALGLDTDGALLLLDEEGRTQRFIAGDVSLRV